MEFSSIDNLRNRKLEQTVLLAYENGINIKVYKNICGKGNEPRER